jgi:anti-anti-sigma factor
MCVRQRNDHAPLLQQRLIHLLEGAEPGPLVDLSGVTFIICFATRLLAQTCRRAEGRPCSIQLVTLSKLVERLAELTRLAGELPVAGPIAAGPPALGA